GLEIIELLWAEDISARGVGIDVGTLVVGQHLLGHELVVPYPLPGGKRLVSRTVLVGRERRFVRLRIGELAAAVHDFEDEAPGDAVPLVYPMRQERLRDALLLEIGEVVIHAHAILS